LSPFNKRGAQVPIEETGACKERSDVLFNLAKIHAKQKLASELNAKEQQYRNIDKTKKTN